MSDKVFVYIDQFKGEALPASWEAVGVARSLAGQLGGGVTALVFGSGVEGVAQKAIHYGADTVLLVDDPVLADYRPEPYATQLSKIIQDNQPSVVLFPTTIRARELAGMSAVDLKTGVLADVTSLDVQNGRVSAFRPVYAGKLLAKVECKTEPQMITLRSRAFEKPGEDTSRTGTVTKVAPAVQEEAVSTKVTGYSQAEAGVSLTEAGVIVSGGRGVSNNPSLTPPAGMNDKDAEIWRAQQGFKLVGDLANVLGGAMGASRAAVDAGYIPYSHQVGQTGKLVSPDLYIACGISGAIQHQAGMRNSKVIVAVNKDPEAPIFKLARYGVVGDLFQILPELSKAFRKKLGKE